MSLCYLRVSTSEQASPALGVMPSGRPSPRYAERKGLTIVEEYCDEGISAKSLRGRPAALAALDAVRAGKAAGLLVAKMDRLSRSVVDGAGLMERAGRRGGRCTSPTLNRHQYSRRGDGGPTSSSPGLSTSAA